MSTSISNSKRTFIKIVQWVHLKFKNSSFYIRTYNNISFKKIVLCKSLINLSNNSCKVDLPSIMDISLIFNVVNLYPYMIEDYILGNSNMFNGIWED